MTSHSPLFLPAFSGGTGNSEWMSRHRGVRTYLMLTSAVAGSLHWHDVLDKGCRGKSGQHTERTGERGRDEWKCTSKVYITQLRYEHRKVSLMHRCKHCIWHNFCFVCEKKLFVWLWRNFKASFLLIYTLLIIKILNLHWSSWAKIKLERA